MLWESHCCGKIRSALHKGHQHPQRCAHLQQLPLHLITDQVWGLPPLPALQVICCDGIRHLGSIECPFQPQLLSCQQVGLCIQILNLLLKLRLPVVDVLHCCALRQLFRFISIIPGLLTAGQGLVEQVIISLVPFGGQILGSAEAGRGKAAGGIRPRLQRRLVNLHRQLSSGHCLRCRLFIWFCSEILPVSAIG
uniref:Uncharacterized protein n=1 Tax=Coturnix japonica TaxID=93934 RepID=A0A8C2SYR5_COTJA